MGLMDLLGGLLGGKRKGRGRAASEGPLGGLDSMLPGGLGALTGGKGGLLKVLLPMLLGGGAGKAMGGLGGLGGMLDGLTKGGLGGKVNSWVGTGANEDVTPDELEAALGRDKVADIARQAGVSHEEARSGLAGMLPKLIDQVTPGGSVPDAAGLGQLVKGLDLQSLLR